MFKGIFLLLNLFYSLFDQSYRLFIYNRCSGLSASKNVSYVEVGDFFSEYFCIIWEIFEFFRSFLCISGGEKREAVFEIFGGLNCFELFYII
jgi:hypothetical protein